ncbi:unnamed protein product, partial [Protopolystoma xenopodis]
KQEELSLSPTIHSSEGEVEDEAISHGVIKTATKVLDQNLNRKGEEDGDYYEVEEGEIHTLEGSSSTESSHCKVLVDLNLSENHNIRAKLAPQHAVVQVTQKPGPWNADKDQNRKYASSLAIVKKRGTIPITLLPTPLKTLTYSNFGKPEQDGYKMLDRKILEAEKRAVEEATHEDKERGGEEDELDNGGDGTDHGIWKPTNDGQLRRVVKLKRPLRHAIFLGPKSAKQSRLRQTSYHTKPKVTHTFPSTSLSNLDNRIKDYSGVLESKDSQDNIALRQVSHFNQD